MSLSTYDPDRPRDPMPSLGEIFLYWYGEKFDGLKFQRIPDVCDPWCFRCGWLAPTKFDLEKIQSKNPKLTGDALLGPVWDEAHGWLERCHLWDHAEGGGETVDNLVPMCVACHRVQPPCDSREAGLAFVNENVTCPEWLREFTDIFRGRHLGYLRRSVAFWIGVSNHWEAKYKALADTIAAGETPTRLPDPESASYYWPLSQEIAQMIDRDAAQKRKEREAAWDTAYDALVKVAHTDA